MHMDLRSLPLVLLICSSLVRNNGVQGDKPLFREEDLGLEGQLKLINKPAVKTIETEYGDIYDCVDFYKQPAFDHPLLKDHNFHFEMRPTSVPQGMGDDNRSTTNEPPHIGLKYGGCPIGTVPIRKTTKDDLIREKLLSERYGWNSTLTMSQPGTHYAIVRTRNIPGRKYNGAQMTITVYNPFVKASQYSSGQMKIQNGPDSITVGWTVNPGHYRDKNTRLFTYLNAGRSHCFNTQCPGFIIVNVDIPLDSVISPVSKRGGPIYVITLFVYRDAINGNWWLEVGKNSTPIGFWPSRIFTELSKFATHIEWGGEVHAPPSEPSPPMGSSWDPIDWNPNKDAYCKQVVVVDEAHKFAPATDTEIFVDGDAYGLLDEGNVGGGFQRLIFFGGAGGMTGN